jgi:hypothetical protein
MKRILFTILGLGLLSVSAQVKEKINYDYPQFKIVVKNENKNNNAKREVGKGWFDYATAYNDFNGAGITSFVSFIQPDTNLYTVGTDGAKTKTGFHILGRVNDPRDEVFSNNPARFSKHNTYTWDSIRFTQFYVRFADFMKVGANTVPIVDTVFIQYFLPAGLDNKSYVYQADPNKAYYYSCPKVAAYNPKTRLNSGAYKTDTIFLTKAFADSVSLNGAQTSFFGRTLSIPVGINVPHNSSNPNSSIIGHTITFKPMKKPAVGDTGIAYNGSTWNKKYNMYGVRLYSKAGVTVDNSDKEAQNNSVITNFEIVYGQTVSIFKSYLPGTVFTNTIFEGTDYHLTTQTLSVKNVDANGNGLGNIYPNPSNSNNEVFVPVKLASAQNVTLSIYDVTGKLLKTISADYEAGDFDVAVSTSGLSNGVYTCTMTAADFTATTKFILN